MDFNKIFAPLLWPFLKLFIGILLFALFLGLVIGIFTYGRPVKKHRNNGLLDEAADIGIELSHILIGWIIGKYKKNPRQGTWLNDQEILNRLRGMQPNEFEEYIAKMFTGLGFQTRLVGGSGDGGIDIEMTKNGRRHLVQCKKFITRKVNPHDVRDFYGAMGDRHIDGKGFIVTTNIFTLEAERFAEDKPIELIYGARLIQFIRESGLVESQIPIQTTTASSQQKQLCLKCGGQLVERTNPKDGSRFFGCSAFPRCTYTKPI